MPFTDFFVKKPVFASVLSLVILLAGLKAFSALPVRQYPNIAVSVVTVSTVYTGASADIIEGFITTPLEAALSGIDGIDFISSESTSSQSNISVTFKLGYDINKGMTDVSNAVASARFLLPKEVQDPVIAQDDPNAKPIIFIPFLSTVLSPEQITDYLIRFVQPQMATVSGISKSVIYGERLYAMRLWLDPYKMAAHHVTARDIMDTLNKNNVQTAAGHIDSRFLEFNVNARTDLASPEGFNQLVIKNDQGRFIRIQDIGHAQLGPKDDTVRAAINGQEAVVLALQAQPTANPVTIAKQVYRLFPTLQTFFPRGLHGEILYDASRFITQSVKEVYKTILEASLFVVIIIFLFLGSLRNALIPMVTIPLSVIGVCSFMLALGYTINTLTLLAFVLAVGLVVDDAIVVVENIHRHIENGLTPLNAAFKGAREIGFAVIAMTLTLAAVYAPIGFLTGLTGSLFREFAFTLAFAVIISGFVALTLSPMMCSKLLLPHGQRPRFFKVDFSEKIDRLFKRLMGGYQTLLGKLLMHRKAVLIFAVMIYGIGGFLYKTLSQELAPQEDKGYFLAVMSGPSNANLDYTTEQTKRLESIYKAIPEQRGYGVFNGIGGGPSSAFSFVVLAPWEQRTRTAQTIINSLYPAFLSWPAEKAFPFNPSDLPGTSGNTPVRFVLKTTQSYETLNQAAQKLIATVKKENPQLLNPDSDLSIDQSQVFIDIDRNKASDLGISMDDIYVTLNIALAQPTVSRFNLSGRSYDVIPQIFPDFRMTSQQLGELNVATQSAALVPLSAVAHIHSIIQAPSLNHFQQLRAATFSANLAPGYTLGEALRYLEKTAKAILPETIQYDFSGQSRQFMEAVGQTGSTFLFALIFIFLVLSAQFESFRDPLIVMTSVPLSLTGALGVLHLLPTGTLNIYTQIGLVTLIGLISKHGILIVEFANQLQKKGYSKIEAVSEAATIRLRPVLMTTLAMILGASPLAFSTGAGAAARSQLGWVIAGGMAFGTLFTLMILPIVYYYLAGAHKKEV